MPTYAVLLKQKEEGCDYMIGCGMTWDIFEAPDLQHAHIKAREVIMEEEEPGCLSRWHEERNLKKAILVEIKAELPIKGWFDEFNSKVAAMENLAKVNAEKAEFEHLKAKFERP